MALTQTLTNLIAEVRRRADMENSTFVSDAEVTNYINQSYAELYDLLIQQYGEDYNVTESTVSTTSALSYNLPSDFYKLVGADLLISGTYGDSGAEYVTLEPYQFAERNKYDSVSMGFNQPSRNWRYKILGDKLRFIKPEASKTVVLFYHPRITRLTTGTDTIDGVNGWDEYVIVDAAMKCLVKEESDVSVLMASKQQLQSRIKMMAAQRDVGQSERVTDVTSGSYGFEDCY